MPLTIAPAPRNFSGTYEVPGDKSISHRAVMLGSLAQGVTEVSGFLTGEDCLSTIACFRALGVEIAQHGTNVRVEAGPLRAPSQVLDVGNSGTTLCLMTGLLAGQPFQSTLTGDASIQKRPMGRVVAPLSQMGAKISGNLAPVTVTGTPLTGMTYTLPVASAQVKSAILLAGLHAAGETRVTEPVPTRDHTEIMLAHLGADIHRETSNTIVVRRSQLTARPLSVPGDISSAAFLLAVACIFPGTDLRIQNVGVNPTRTGIIHVLRRMGARITLENERTICGEPVADLHIVHQPLRGTDIAGDEIPTLIDEIPILAAVAMFAEGKTTVRDAEELRVKEVDRIQVVANEFNAFAAGRALPIIPREDGMEITGGLPLTGATVHSRGDHRLAMSLSIIAMALQPPSILENSACANVSFPGFYQMLRL